MAIGALSDGTKVLIGLTAGYRESAQSWGELLRDLNRRGLRAPKLVVGGGNLGAWAALAQVYPEAEPQRCWNHKIANVLDRLPKRCRDEAKALLTAILCAPTEAAVQRAKAAFERWCEAQGFDKAAWMLGSVWERMVTFDRFPLPTTTSMVPF